MAGHGDGSAAAWLGHPVTLAAVAVLLVNDHVLKAAWPGALTGKLSDVAGLLVAPPLLAFLVSAVPRAVVVRRLLRLPDVTADPSAAAVRRAAVAATVLVGVGFALVKACPAGALLAERVWEAVTPSARVVPDPTDLAALPVLGLAWLVRARALRPSAAARGARRARLLLGLPSAVVAVAATSALPVPPSATHVEAHDAVIVVFGGPDATMASSDEGRTWHTWNGMETGPSRTSACVPGEPRRCYRVVPRRLKVEQSDDAGATWSTAWEISPGRQRWLERGHQHVFGGTTLEEYADDEMASVALAVLPVPEGHVVAVANGPDGVVLRDPAGRWHRLGFTEYGDGLSEQAALPLAEGGDLIGGETAIAFLAGLLVLLVLLGFAGWRARAYAGFAVSSAFLWCGMLMVLELERFEQLPLRALGLLMALGGLVALIAVWGSSGAPRPPAIAPAPLTAVAVYWPFYAWSAGWIDDYGRAVAAAVFSCVLVLALAVVLLRRSFRRAAAARATS
ncbi:hypothetical protein [Microbispora sp. ATCC PTA-5024]|uniref:hypothetical protein n=1 Tax=Microbispora sp. ATCC PTA-5024 TaxID=316330 RepID=UPI0003DB6D7B|nr:hypothetical protein [Microbispora sp. ATCC PTA-5024]ETK34301.1 hypothetical protein MPTA5024_19975 [Microbispora sp. ATCC PTA-5024]